MKVTSLRYLDAKFHHPSLGASPPNRGKYCKSICLPPEVSLLLKRRSVNKFRHRYTMLWPLSVVLVQRTVGYPSTSWASCLHLFLIRLLCCTLPHNYLTRNLQWTRTWWFKKKPFQQIQKHRPTYVSMLIYFHVAYFHKSHKLTFKVKLQNIMTLCWWHLY